MLMCVYEVKKNLIDSSRMILWYNHWWQRASVAQRLVQDLQTNEAATAAALQGYTT